LSTFSSIATDEDNDCRPTPQSLISQNQEAFAAALKNESHRLSALLHNIQSGSTESKRKSPHRSTKKHADLTLDRSATTTITTTTTSKRNRPKEAIPVDRSAHDAKQSFGSTISLHPNENFIVENGKVTYTRFIHHH
jgi:hypothetical protein